MDDIKVMYRWDKLSEKIMKHHGGIPGIIKFFEEGARTPSDDALLIFFNGEDQLGGFESGKDKIDYLIHPDQKSMGIQITIIMTACEDEPCYPMISVSEEIEEADWDFPDEVWILTETEEMEDEEDE